MIIIDIEASSLSEYSYPVEVGWKDFLTGESDQFLINPDTAIDWDDWDENAEFLHGLTREELVSKGISIHQAVQRLSKALSGKTLFSDAGIQDSRWIRTLFDEAMSGRPEFHINDIFGFLNQKSRGDAFTYLDHYSREHRALSDCDALMDTLKITPPEYWKAEFLKLLNPN